MVLPAAPSVVFPDTVSEEVTVALFVEVLPDTVKFPVCAKIPVEVIVLPAAPKVVFPDTVRFVDTVARPFADNSPFTTVRLLTEPRTVLPIDLRKLLAVTLFA